MLWMKVPDEQFGPRLYLNGFPKAGLHWLELLVRPFTRPQMADPHSLAMWVSSHEGVWTEEWLPFESICWNWSTLRIGAYLKGHCGYHPVYESFGRLMGLSHVFIYRDLRDVAVSQTFHILSEDPQFIHPGRETFKYVGGFDEVLTSVIEGFGPFPGIIERWEVFAPWLDVEWVHKVRFEDGLENPEQCAFDIVDYGIDRTVVAVGAKLKLSKVKMQELSEKMAHSSQQTFASPTFREGKTGGWKNHFTDEHRKLFKEKAGDWLIKLGYEKNNKW